MPLLLCGVWSVEKISDSEYESFISAVLLNFAQHIFFKVPTKRTVEGRRVRRTLLLFSKSP